MGVIVAVVPVTGAAPTLTLTPGAKWSWSSASSRTASFFILFLVLVTPTAVFGAASLIKLYDVLEKIYETPPSQANQLLKEKPTSQAELRAFPTRALVALEADVVAYREHRGEALLATRTWLRFMSVLFGSILVTIGAAFILGKISTPKNEVAMEGWSGFKTSFATSSPGLALVILGCVLILFRNGYDERIEIRDGAIYFSNAAPPMPAVPTMRAVPSPRNQAEKPSNDFQNMLEQLGTPGGAK